MEEYQRQLLLGWNYMDKILEEQKTGELSSSERIASAYGGSHEEYQTSVKKTSLNENEKQSQKNIP